ncbi:phytosulfokines 5-like [Panicum miliaceum]|uniref:Phytosulfokine n=1 Tax=Panicum miliaceum TaxID=4540 RepID=A0A3L6PIM3_PANMI|nr:phytosulfokines 5-like [Panicum miliaceum]
MRRCGGPSSPAPAPALLLLLLICFFHCAAAAARPLPAAAVPLQVHQENGVRVAADDEPAVLQKGAAGSGDGLSLPVSGVTGAEEDPAAECEEGNDGCLQRRLLRDAHLDYIYTQHKGKP